MLACELERHNCNVYKSVAMEGIIPIFSVLCPCLKLHMPSGDTQWKLGSVCLRGGAQETHALERHDCGVLSSVVVRWVASVFAAAPVVGYTHPQ